MEPFPWKRLALLLFSAALLFAPPAAAKVLRYASQVDPGTMDPHALASLYNNRVLSQIYETLVDRDESFRPGPRLALSWTPLDAGRGWRFKLRPGVKFRDGTPFTADDVVFNVTQDFKAKEETHATRNTNGTGPFRLGRWETDVKTVLLAHPGYWGKRGNVTEAHYLVVGSAATRVAGLISGEIDLVVDPAVQDVVRLRSQPGITVGEATATGSQFLGFNHTRGDLGGGTKGNPFRDARVRQAIRAAIDVGALKSKVMRETSTTGRALYSSAVDGFDPRFNAPAPYDPARAKALLKEAGYADGFAVELDCSAQQPTDALCQAISGMLSRVGIRVTYRPLPFNTLLPKIIAGDTNMYVIGWTAATVEPEGVLVPLAHTRTAPGVGEYNFGGYSNAKVDAAIDKGRVEFDPARRAALFTEAMLAIDADAGFIPLVYRKITWAMRKPVKAVIRPNDILDLRMVNIE